MKLQKKHGGSGGGGHFWEKDGDIIHVPDLLGRELLALDSDQYTEVLDEEPDASVEQTVAGDDQDSAGSDTSGASDADAAAGDTPSAGDTPPPADVTASGKHGGKTVVAE